MDFNPEQLAAHGFQLLNQGQRCGIAWADARYLTTNADFLILADATKANWLSKFFCQVSKTSYLAARHTNPRQKELFFAAKRMDEYVLTLARGSSR